MEKDSDKKVCRECGLEKVITGNRTICAECRRRLEWYNGTRFKDRFRMNRKRAERFEVEDDLTYDEFVEILHDYVCPYCGEDTAGKSSIDHVLPLALGYGNNRGNIVNCCTGCNTSKGNDDLYSFYLRSDKFTEKLYEIFLRKYAALNFGDDSKQNVERMRRALMQLHEYMREIKNRDTEQAKAVNLQ
ncbi:HNH endonuclease [Bacillus sp. Marseille-P3661]|uniref:HNH endonuclease n=1 Tax=Bacillus sp. Marseille-P3661 TaxID=1936234 RepID=UPI000C83A4AD|nr:HNH endonuclease [Bacillus sp. Marseille-P3661]